MASRGTVVGASMIVNHGADGDHFVLVLVAEGFTAAEQTDFETAADAFVTTMQATAPYDDASVWQRLNVYRLDVESDDSGADNPLTCPDDPVGYVPLPPETAETYLQTGFCSSSIRRLLTVTELDTLLADLDTFAPAWDAAVVIVNHLEYGGAGDEANSIATCSLDVRSSLIAIHELGHVLGLRDEYDVASGDVYPGSEPDDPNITTDPAGAKWAGLITASNLPTWPSPDCTLSNEGAIDPEPGAIGTYEGADYYHCGIYRPAHDCTMRHLGVPFCAVCDAHLRDYLAAPFFVNWDRVDSSSGCFVATAVYGDPHHPDVETIRGWRDRGLADGAVAMRTLDRVYRRVGPSLGAVTLDHPRLADALRRRLFAPLATHLRGRGRESN